MKWIIDRFDGDCAVIEFNDICFNVPKTALPSDASEGDVLNVETDVLETETRKKQLKGKLKKLFGE